MVEQIALYLPIPSFLNSFIDCPLYNNGELQQHEGMGEKKKQGTSRRWETIHDKLMLYCVAGEGQTISFSKLDLVLAPASNEFPSY